MIELIRLRNLQEDDIAEWLLKQSQQGARMPATRRSRLGRLARHGIGTELDARDTAHQSRQTDFRAGTREGTMNFMAFEGADPLGAVSIARGQYLRATRWDIATPIGLNPLNILIPRRNVAPGSVHMLGWAAAGDENMLGRIYAAVIADQLAPDETAWTTVPVNASPYVSEQLRVDAGMRLFGGGEVERYVIDQPSGVVPEPSQLYVAVRP